MESCVEAETRDGSDSTVNLISASDKFIEVAPGSSVNVTEEELLRQREDEEEDIFLDSSTHTIVPDTFSDMDEDFDPELPTEYGKFEQATHVKDVVVEKEIDNGKSEKKLPFDDGKFEKKVPALVKKESTESAEASKPPAKPEIVIPLIAKEETDILIHNDKFLADLGCITMLTKKNFKDSGHLKSGRYFLSEAPLLNNEASESGLLRNLAMMASVSPCAATYQRCYSEVPMVRLWSKSIDDNSSMKFQYWDNYFLDSGHPVGIIIPTQKEIEWLSTPSEEEKAIIELA